MRAKDHILQLFESNNELTVKEIVNRSNLSRQMVHLIIKQLVEEKIVERLNHPPKTIYRLIPVPTVDTSYLEENFSIVTETGNLLQGQPAFQHWCRQRSLPIEKALGEYRLAREGRAWFCDAFGIVHGLYFLLNKWSYGRIWLDDLNYFDFDAVERFGRTRLGTLLHYAKEGQNKYLMGMLMDSIGDRIREFLQRNKADAVGFVPPTIRRELQLMHFLQTQLNVPLPVVEIIKVSGAVAVSQTSISHLQERNKNAENTYAVTDRRSFHHVVLLDDLVNSGATLNQIASKLRNKGIAEKITGLTIVGSLKDFDLITDPQKM